MRVAKVKVVVSHSPRHGAVGQPISGLLSAELECCGFYKKKALKSLASHEMMRFERLGIVCEGYVNHFDKRDKSFIMVVTGKVWVDGKEVRANMKCKSRKVITRIEL